MLFSIVDIEMKCLYALVVLAVLLVLLRFKPFGEGFGQGFGEESNEGFGEGFESTKSVVICKAEWCGHCKTAAPEFQRLVSASPITLSNGSKVNVTMLDADADKDKLSMYKIRGFPTILVNNGSDMLEYPGERTYNGVLEYLNNM
jgi:thiol-disulfide isomerase/thioredoxin